MKIGTLEGKNTAALIDLPEKKAEIVNLRRKG
jgi:hypothetical protein